MTKKVMFNLFDKSRTEVVQIDTQQQRGGQDCGLFTTAIATSIVSELMSQEYAFIKKKWGIIYMSVLMQGCFLCFHQLKFIPHDMLFIFQEQDNLTITKFN